MSIYGSLPAPDDDPRADGTVAAPLVYQGSHILPDERTDPRGGYVDIALIPSHITRDGRDERPEDGPPWPYLRFGVNGATVVLTRDQVEQIVMTLTWWLHAVSREGTA